MPAYAATIHKNQGSEYPAVVILVVHHQVKCPNYFSDIGDVLQRLVSTWVTCGRNITVVLPYPPHPTEAAELALAHTVGSKVERAYRRSDLFDRRRDLAERWSAYCGSA